jgi:hypothetical protein
MANNQYMSGRKKYRRPQAILFSNNPGIVESGSRLPVGYEIGANTDSVSYDSLIDQFIILSDDNRQPIDFKIIRIEKRERMINGRMRSHHIADKRSFSVSWNMLPSRAFSADPEFDLITGNTIYENSGKPNRVDSSYTTDGGAGGTDILDWYNTHKGSFWVFLSYDNYKEMGLDYPSALSNSLVKYNEVIEMFITDFTYSVQKRGGTNHDLWNISMTLEEV